jgi:lysophospholipase L1-like esterase
VQPAPEHMLCLGDSYTVGEAVNSDERWPAQFAKRVLQTRNRSVRLQLIAKTGWTTDELSAAIDLADAAGEILPSYDCVSLSIGVNNQYRDRSVTNYADEFAALLARAVGYAAGATKRQKAAHVLVLSIPDWGQTPFAANDSRGPEKIAAQIDVFNTECERQARSAGAHFIDVTTLSRCGDPNLIANDGLHPSANAYAQWAEMAAKQLFGSLAHARAQE